MAYEDKLALLVRKALSGVPDLVEKKMFGGVGYIVNGNMACGVLKGFLIVRVGPDRYQDALEQPHTSVFDITGRPMTGWVMVSQEGWDSEDVLNTWVRRGLDFAATLPKK